MSENSVSGAIAIVGMACRLPGADELDQFWNLIRSATSAVGPLPPDRLNRELYFHPERGQVGKTYSDLGGIVKARPFDRDRCPLPDEVFEQVDVAHLTLLEVAADACRDGGYDPYRMPFRNVGVFVGHTGGSPLVSDYLYSTVVEEGSAALHRVGQLQTAGLDASAIRQQVIREVRRKHPGRQPHKELRLGALVGSELISDTFNLHGPYMVVDAACASSLQAMAVGIRSLLLGKLDAAIVGGASYCKADSLVLFSAAQSASATGTCPFSREADGLVSAEGYIVFLLKTLERAVRDGDRIHAVISGLGVASDGRGKSLWAPRAEGQILAVQRAYAGSLDANRLQYIEAHATSTQVGDATELQALSEALKKMLKDPLKRIPIGSVKGNVGHTLETAGVAGLLKTVLSLKKQIIPPAVRCRELNTEVDWSACPFYVPFEEQPWPEFADGHPRRAAVNSFGIGGLNVHVVVDEYQPQPGKTRNTARLPASSHTAADDDGAVAIIGMGCIFPGAHTLEAFWEQLRQGRDPKIEAPATRIPREGYDPAGPQTWRTYSLLGGFVEGWQYDWRRHKIPPKQIAQANPLQFMLLDAADQAFQNAGLDPKSLPGTRTSVIVGTIFGGDFSDQLQMGLRLPEFRATLRGVLQKHRVPADQIAAVEEGFQEQLLQLMPALLDETGSFTSSTLASRITKSFNLMGGALALDAGDCSAALVIQAGVDQLRLGHADMLVCAAGQRSMDLWCYEGLALAGCLARTPRSGLDAKQEGFVPGEGCGVVILKRLKDAQRDGNPIRGVIRGIGVWSNSDRQQAVENAAAMALGDAGLPAAAIMAVESCATRTGDREPLELRGLMAAYSPADRIAPVAIGDLSSQIGHTGGASAMAALLKCTLASHSGEFPPTLYLEALETTVARAKSASAPTRLTSLPTVAGTQYRAAAVSSVYGRMAFQIVLDNGVPKPAFDESPPRAGQANFASAASAERASTGVARFAADSGAALRKLLLTPDSSTQSAFSAAPDAAFAKRKARCTILAATTQDLAKKIPLAAEFITSGRHDLAVEQGIFFATEATLPAKVAMLFPGQGSQYAGMFRTLCEQHSPVRADVEHADELMRRSGYPSFADLAWDPKSPLGKDVWTTQIAMLLADWLAWRSTQHLGLRPDFVAGHSFGEFPALVAAGAWTLEEAILATRARCDAVLECAGGDTLMLSLTAGRTLVESLLLENGRHVWFCAENGPEQCVVGGASAEVRAFAESCEKRRIRCTRLAVPCAFHTPLMKPAQGPLERALEQRRITQPQLAFTSTTFPCFITQPVDLRASLVAQMTHPVEFAATIRRLVQSGANTFIELGPSQVLSHLTRRILDGAADFRILPLDAPHKPAQDLIVRLTAACEAWGITLGGTGERAPRSAVAGAEAPIRVIDATERRRQRMRQQAAQYHDKSAPRPTPASPPARRPQSPTSIQRAARNGNPNGNGATLSAAASALASGNLVPEKNVVALRSPPLAADQPEPWDERAAQLVHDVMSAHGLARGTRLRADEQWAAHITSAPEFLEDLAECFDLATHDRQSLQRATTLGGLVQILQSRPGKTDWLATRRPPSVAASPPGADLQQFLIDFVVEQTGYPPEIVELDADLEADLGIDSIKKAQLFGELGQRFQLSADPNLSLDEFPTLRHVLDYLNEHAETGARATAPQQEVRIEQESVTQRPRGGSQATALLEMPKLEKDAPVEPSEDLQAFLVNFVVEQTGYPPEIVELDADLEADLGIDSIKKAQLFGEIGGRFRVAADPNLSLDDFTTLRHVLQYLRDHGEGAVAARNSVAKEPAPASEEAPAVESAAAIAPQPEPAPTMQSSRAGVSSIELQAFLIDFVVEQTGYPPEIVELDADLEADLGIDSIKKAQLFGEIGNHFQLAADPNLTLDDFPTLRHVLDYLSLNVASAAVAAPVIVESRAVAAPPASAAYDRGFLHGREYREAIRSALRRVAAATDTQASAVSLQWFDRLSQEESDELSGIADGAEVLPANLIAWQSLLGSARHPITTQVQLIDESGNSATAVSGWARVESALCVEQTPETMALRIPGQLGAIAGVNRHGVLLACTADSAQRDPEAIPASIILGRALASATGAQDAIAAAGSAGALDSCFVATQLGRAELVSLMGHGNGRASIVEKPFSGTLTQIQRKLDASPAPAWVNGRAAALGGLPAHRAFHLLVTGECSWLHLHDDGVGDNGAVQWQRLELPFALPSVAKAPPAAEEARLRVEFPPGSRVTKRFVPRLVPAGPQTVAPRHQRASAAIIYGDAPHAAVLASELAAQGLEVRRLTQRLSPTDLERQLTARMTELPQASLILALAQPTALPGDQASWSRDSQELLLNPFRACQLWISKCAAAKAPLALMAAVTMGGNFGLESSSISPWSGGLAGLLKGLRHEYPQIAVRIVDVASELETNAAGRLLAAEFLGSDREVEIGLATSGRKCIRYEAAAAPSAGAPVPQRGDRWVVTGGARGVTGVIASELGRRYGLELHLLGTTPLGELDRRFLDASADELKKLRSEVMVTTKSAGQDPLGAWSKVEKNIEIRRQLAQLRAAGVAATYHVCDLSDWNAVARVLARIRENGPIRGIVHGAGFEAAAKFEKKKLVSVERTIHAKAGGAAALIAATSADDIGWFIALGSTSGRLGGMGQTDYSLANEMLAKEVDWLRRRCPNCRATTFHWHAWDEIGMAARPESRFALESFGLHFMPPPEGVAHLLSELEAGLPEAEVMITEDLLCPAPLRLTSAAAQAASAPVATEGAPASQSNDAPAEDWEAPRTNFVAPPAPEATRPAIQMPLFAEISQTREGSYVARATLDAQRDVFLTNHRMVGRPVLPGVTGCELLTQAVAASAPRGRYACLRNVEVLTGLRFPTDDPRRVEVQVARDAEGYRGVLSSILVERGAGRTESRREHVAGVVAFPDELTLELPAFVKPTFPYNPMVYPEDAAMYHGLAMRMLNGLMFQQGGGWGRLRSPGTASLAGSRPSEGWILPMALLDGCIVGCAVFSWLMCGLRVEIPQGFAELWLLKEPAPEETCQMQFRYLRADEWNTWYDFDLFGQDGQPIALCRGLRLVKFGKDELA